MAIETQHHLMTETEAARLLGVSIRTLQSWRWRRVGPRYTKLGGSVRYRVEDINAFIEEGMQEPVARKTGQ